MKFVKSVKVISLISPSISLDSISLAISYALSEPISVILNDLAKIPFEKGSRYLLPSTSPITQKSC